MIFRRCQCGNCEHYDSRIPPADCQGCDDCGTTYAGRPEDHKPKIPRDWKPQFNRDTGAPDRPRCRRCMARGDRP